MTLEQLVVIIKAETAQLEKAIDRVKGQLSSLDTVASKVGSKITRSFNKTASGLNRTFKALGIGALTAGIVSFGKRAIDAASDLQEWQNVVEVAFGGATSEVNNFAKQAISQFGLSELAAKQLAGTFKAMADGIGLSDAAGRKMAIQLTGLAADMASFFNTTTAATQTALEGVFTGQTRALKQYGIVMNEATLEAYRLERGLDTAYNKMSEAQRVALRYNYVLHATANAQNDFARTSTSWANQMRLLANNWNQLITTIGSGLIRVLQPVLVILNKILSTIIMVINAIAKVFGGKGISVGAGDGGFGGMADNLGDVEDGFNGANKAAKKFKATVAGFDELERLTPQPEDSGSGSGLGGMGDIGVDDLDSYFDLSTLDDTLNKFEEWFQKIKDLMDADNWEGVGSEIAKVLNSWMKAIDDWILNVFEPFGVKWADRIARVLNGLVMDYDWELLGKLFADGLNALIHIANTFLERFDALKLGEGLGRAINSWFNNVDFEGLGHYFANKLNFIIDVAAGFFDKFITQAYQNGQKLGEAFNAFIDWIHWENLSRAIWEGLNSLGETIQGFVDMVKWDELKTNVGNALKDIFENLDIEGIKNAVSSLVDNVMDFLLDIDWYQIGHTVGEMLSGVDWLGVLMDVKDRIIWPAWKGFWDGIMADGKNLLIGWIGKISSWFKESFWGPIAKAAFGAVGFNILLGGIRGFFKNSEGHLLTEMARSAAYVIGSFGGLIPSWGNKTTELFDGAFGASGSVTQSLLTSIKFVGFKVGKSFGTWGASIKEAFSGIGAVVKGMNPWMIAAAAAVTSLISSYGGLGGVLDRVKKVFSDTIKHVKDFANSIGFSDKIQKLKDAFSHLLDPLKRVYEVLGKLKPVWEVFFTTLSGIATTALNTIVGVIGGLAEVLAGIVDIVAGVVGLIVDVVTLNFTNLKTDIENIWNGIVEFFQGIWDAIIGGITGFVQGVIDWFKDLKYNLIGDPIVLDLVDGIINAFTGMFEAIITKVQEWITNMITWFQDLQTKAIEIFTAIKTFLEETWNLIKTTVETIWTAIKDFLELTWNLIKTTTETIWTAIYTWLNETWTNLQNLITTFWESFKEIIETGWNWIKTTTQTIWEAIQTLLTTIWNAIKTLFSTALEALKTLVSNAWTAIKTTTNTIWNALKSLLEGIWNSIKSTAQTVSSQIAGFWTSAYDKITGAWSKFKSFWHGVWDGAAGVVKSAINGVIGVLNGFGFTNPFTGEWFGFSIPYLADGGVISSPTVAMMGEYAGAGSNPEIVAPESKIREIISSENGEMVSALYQIARQIIDAIEDVDMTVSIGDDAIAEAANRGNNAYKRRTGKPLFSM